MDESFKALVALGRHLKAEGYRFVAVTPTTHQRILERPDEQPTLRSIFGWNGVFEREEVSPHLFALLSRGKALSRVGDRYRSLIRFATLGDMVFGHSAFPTIEADAVFFGPDTYRFVRFVRAAIADMPKKAGVTLVDVGAGSGAGGLCTARLLPDDAKILLTEINARAMTFCSVNAAINNVQSAKTIFSDLLGGVEGEPDLIIANPPYLIDAERRLYRHGGGNLGISLAERIVAEGLARLAPQGRLVLYTGIPVLAGADPFFESIEPLLKLHCTQFVYEEIDPDVFGEELERGVYAGVDRIAAVGLVAVK